MNGLILGNKKYISKIQFVSIVKDQVTKLAMSTLFLDTSK